jgi:hypothetical protein
MDEIATEASMEAVYGPIGSGSDTSRLMELLSMLKV